MKRNIANARKANNALSEEAPGVSSLLANLASFAGLTLISSTYQLIIKQPLIVAAEAGTVDFAVAADQWLAPIMEHCKQTPQVMYEPFLEIMEAKTKEVSA
jgi:hypothetical protein